MKNLTETIKHFESLQKRYTTEHNGKMCDRVQDALDALSYYKKTSAEWVPASVKIKMPCLEGLKPDCFVMAGYKCTHCGHEALSISNYCPDCGFSMSSDEIEIE